MSQIDQTLTISILFSTWLLLFDIYYFILFYFSKKHSRHGDKLWTCSIVIFLFLQFFWYFSYRFEKLYEHMVWLSIQIKKPRSSNHSSYDTLSVKWIHLLMRLRYHVLNDLGFQVLWVKWTFLSRKYRCPVEVFLTSLIEKLQ